MNGKVTITVPMVPPSPNVMKRKYRHFMAYKRLREDWEKTLLYFTPTSGRAMLQGWKLRADV